MVRIHQHKGLVSNLYIIEDAPLFLVDSGYSLDVKGVLQKLHALGKRPADIDLIVLTHHDADHSGGARALTKITGARLAVYPTAADPLKSLFREPRRLFIRAGTSFNHFLLKGGYMRMARQALSHRRKRRTSGWIPATIPGISYGRSMSRRSGPVWGIRADVMLGDGMPVPGHPDWTVVHTPGHSHGSICLYHMKSKSLISGDTLLTNGGKPVLSPIYESRRELMSSLRRLQSLNVTALYPGHGSVLRGRGILTKVVP